MTTSPKIVFTTSKAKNLHHSHGVAWTANLYANGKLVAKLEQAGWGACDNHEWLDRTVWDAFVEQATEHNNATIGDDVLSYLTPRTPNNWPDPDFCSMFIQKLLADADFRAFLHQHCKTKICIRMPGQKDSEFSTIKVPPTPANIAAVKAKYPDATILNGSV